MNIRIIADNGGGLTLQLTGKGWRYQHTYTDPKQCAEDLSAAHADEDSVVDWDGNESEDWVEVSWVNARNGHYEIYDSIRELLNDVGEGKNVGRSAYQLAHHYAAISGQEL